MEPGPARRPRGTGHPASATRRATTCWTTRTVGSSTIRSGRHGNTTQNLWHPLIWIWPWGAGLIALADLSPQLVVVLAVAYAQTVVATDTVRLYQWAWPVVAVATAGVVPLAWLLPLAVLHIASPFKGQGA